MAVGVLVQLRVWYCLGFCSWLGVLLALLVMMYDISMGMMALVGLYDYFCGLVVFALLVFVNVL
ncbi:hypothetical protein QBC34DRAFT_388089 [Podospora aff. communis PSN243]|uniref:NADH dehydrogenase subunit 6 n=1 Tax=Podospora aff. communis PSN243 TaxID=3040156 RepID=A0AAV9H5Y2_9PEZI|nr:hypothetical protein QBC34DRAFT_388089 [Podospora aff. communis PSN243]